MLSNNSDVLCEVCMSQCVNAISRCSTVYKQVHQHSMTSSVIQLVHRLRPEICFYWSLFAEIIVDKVPILMCAKQTDKHLKGSYFCE